MVNGKSASHYNTHNKTLCNLNATWDRLVVFFSFFCLFVCFFILILLGYLIG